MDETMLSMLAERVLEYLNIDPKLVVSVSVKSAPGAPITAVLELALPDADGEFTSPSLGREPVMSEERLRKYGAVSMELAADKLERTLDYLAARDRSKDGIAD